MGKSSGWELSCAGWVRNGRTAVRERRNPALCPKGAGLQSAAQSAALRALRAEGASLCPPPPSRPSPAAGPLPHRSPRGSLLPTEPCVRVCGTALFAHTHPRRGASRELEFSQSFRSGGGKRRADYVSQRAPRAAEQPMGSRDGRRPGYKSAAPRGVLQSHLGSAEWSVAVTEEERNTSGPCGRVSAQRWNSGRCGRAGVPGGCGVAEGPALRYCPWWEAGVGRRPGAGGLCLRGAACPPGAELR